MRENAVEHEKELDDGKDTLYKGQQGDRYNNELAERAADDKDADMSGAIADLSALRPKNVKGEIKEENKGGGMTQTLM